MLKSTHTDPKRTRLCLLFLTQDPVSFSLTYSRDILSGPFNPDCVPHPNQNNMSDWLTAPQTLSDATLGQIRILLATAEWENFIPVLICDGLYVPALTDNFLCPLLQLQFVAKYTGPISVGLSLLSGWLDEEARKELGILLGYMSPL